MSDESAASGSPGEVGTGRLEAFSDGVLAIAITLLVLDVHVPPLTANTSGTALLHALGRQWPTYLAYLISFLTIGIMWINHHNIFRLIGRSDHKLIVINLLLLLCISFVPFPTSLIADSFRKPAESVAAVIYGGWFTLTAVCYGWLWHYVSRRPSLLDPRAQATTVRTVSWRYQIGAPTYAIAAIAGIWSPTITLVICLLLAVFYLFPSSSGAR